MWQGWGQPLAQHQPLRHPGKVEQAVGGRGRGAGCGVLVCSRAKHRAWQGGTVQA